MNKADLNLSDFSIAARNTCPLVETGVETGQAAASGKPSRDPLSPAAQNVTPLLAKPSETQRQEAAEARAIAQDDVRLSLKNLKRAKQRNIKSFINIALDYGLKARLQRAAQENDVKMTSVVKAALDHYLAENGY
jgi:hypothetical protein